MEMLRDSETKVVHCPSSNLKLASGFAKIPEMMDMGVFVSLGADGAPCNNNLDAFMEMRLAALIHKPRLGPTAMPATKVLEMATKGGAEAMGMKDEIGSIEPGKRADIIILDIDHAHAAPTENVNLISRIVYEAKAADVETTFQCLKVDKPRRALVPGQPFRSLDHDIYGCRHIEQCSIEFLRELSPVICPPLYHKDVIVAII
jgi:5-methylthioadenosine/S-adenosylhomocysteine deaminase